MSESRVSISEDEYDVEKICDKRIINGKIQYSIKWNGYSMAENTWEPEEHVDCPELIQEYEESLKKKKPTTHIMSESEGSLSEDVYDVEKICDKKILNGKIQYFIKWKGYSMTENTWEPEEHMYCPELIQEYEESLKKKKPTTSTPLPTKRNEPDTPRQNEEPLKEIKSMPSAIKKNKETRKDGKDLHSDVSDNTIAPVVNGKEPDDDDTKPNGFEKGLIIEKILGATNSYGDLRFLVKWVGVPKAELVPNSLIKIHAPRTLNDFYEEHISW